MEKEKRDSKKIVIPILGVAVLLIAVIGISFAVFSFKGISSKQNSVTTGTLVMTYTENTNGITLTNAMPMTDTAGKVSTNSNEKFEFTVSASITGTSTINYEVAAIKDASSTLLDNEVKLYLEKNGSAVLQPKNFTPIASATTVGSPAGSMLLDSGTFTTSVTNNYVLRMWVAESTVITDVVKTYTVKINVYGKDTAGVEEVQYTPEEYFEFDSATGTITAYDWTAKDKDVVIPKTINGVEVKTIGEEAFQWNPLTSVVIPDSVTSIGYRAFYNNQLTSVTIGNSVTSIGAYAFGDNQLTSVVIPNSVTSIEEDSFESNQLTNVTIGTSVTSIGYGAFNNNQLTSVTIPNSVTSIGNYAFSTNQLTSVTIGNSVTSIGEWAFYSNQLTSVEIPNSVTSIGYGAFYYNYITQGNAKIDNTSGAVTIDHYAFDMNGSNRNTTITPTYLR